MVLLQIRRLGRPVVEVSTSAAPEETRVAVIGYSAEDPVNNPLFLSGVFGGQFGVKRAALGEVLDGPSRRCSSTTARPPRAIPARRWFDLDSAKAVGIHRAGFFMTATRPWTPTRSARSSPVIRRRGGHGLSRAHHRRRAVSHMTGGIAQELPGTLAAGQAFKDWLERKWRAEGRAADETQVLFCSEPQIAGGRSASWPTSERACAS